MSVHICQISNIRFMNIRSIKTKILLMKVLITGSNGLLGQKNLINLSMMIL